MFWPDGKAKTQHPVLRGVAMATLLIFIAWIYVISFIILAAPFSTLGLTVCLCVWGTLLLPCHVSGVCVLW